MRRAWLVLGLLSCAGEAPRPFPLRDPLAIDTDIRPVAVPCRKDPTPKEPDRTTCAPREYFSPFAWDQIDDSLFRPLSNVLAVRLIGEAANANSLDEVADSAWFTNRIGVRPLTPQELALGACGPDDFLPTDVPKGGWLIDHGKDNGATPGFRVKVEGKGNYLLKADESSQPERASAAAVIGAAIYHAAGFNTSCEQIVDVSREQLTLTPGLFTMDNKGIRHPFDEAALKNVLSVTAHENGRSRLQASKWLDGLPLGPFRYVGVRDDDPNDVIPHEDRRELRGSRLLAAWLNHWDAREQNSMDMWLAVDAKNKRSSPGYVRHYILDTSDVFGQTVPPHELGSRLGFAYVVDFGDLFTDLITFGLIEHAWDRVRLTPGREKFGYYSARDFDPEGWKPSYPNPAFVKMTERDGAWMARIIARFSEDDLRALIAIGHFSDPGDSEYLFEVLLARQKLLLARYLTRLSPVADVHVDGAAICALDLARLRAVVPAARFRYTVIERGRGGAIALPVTATPDARVCFAPRTLAPDGLPDDDPARLTIFTLDDGIGAGPLEIHTYDLGARGFRVVGLVRPEPR
jgi:hypothetical protein